MTKVRWGVLSTAAIGVEKAIPAMQRAELCDIVAIASRDASKASGVAQALGVPHGYGSYEELLADPGHRCRLQPTPEPPTCGVDAPRG